MSCYIRHLTDIFETLGLENNRDNRKTMDEAIRRVLKTDKPCPEVWKQLKTILANGKKKEDLVRKLKKQFTEA